MIRNLSGVFKNKPEGSVLVVAMMVLVILTLIGIAATTTSNLENQMSANDVFSKKAFYATESGLNVTAEILAQCNIEHTAPASALITYIGGVGVFLPKVVQIGAANTAKDVTITIADCSSSVDVQRVDTIIEAGGGSEFPSNDPSAPSSTFGIYDLDADGQGPRGAAYSIQAGCKVLIK